MSIVYATSDWHLGHKGIADRFRTEFSSDAAHDHYIVDQAAKILTKRDTVFYVGDMSFTIEGLGLIEQLPGKKILIRGNHDVLEEEHYREVFDEVHGAYRYKGCFITHIPIHPMELYRGYNVHGHCHRGGPRETQRGEEWEKYYNVIGEYNEYKLVPWKKIEEILHGTII